MLFCLIVALSSTVWGQVVLQPPAPSNAPKGPIVYGDPRAAAAAAAAQQRRQQSGAGAGQAGQMLSPLLQALGGGGGKGGTGSQTLNNARAGAAASNAPSGQNGWNYVSSSSLEDCDGMGHLPKTVDEALKQALKFREECRPARTTEEQKIVINDYSGDGTPTMWIFNRGGTCLKKTAITWGVGAEGGGSSGGRPNACAGGGSKLTPPGFHLTGYSNQGASYGPNDSMELVALQGQGSSGRRILIHKAEQPGTASSWGCTGVCFNCYDQVKSMIGFGALVYNYFGSPSNVSPNCSSRAGASNSTSCSLERAVPEATGGQPAMAPRGSGGGGWSGGGEVRK